MGEKKVLFCDRHPDRVITENPALADLQGGPTEIRFPAFASKLALCEECMDELYEHFGRFGERLPGTGAAKGTEMLAYLPVHVVE